MKYFVFASIVALLILAPAGIAKADCNCICSTVGNAGVVTSFAECTTVCSSAADGVVSCADINSTGSTGTGGPTQTSLSNPLGGIASPQQFIGKVIQGILGVTGSLALLMFIYGGFLWMTAAGASERVEKGKQTLLWATLGLIVIFTSYAAVSFITTKILGVK